MFDAVIVSSHSKSTLKPGGNGGAVSPEVALYSFVRLICLGGRRSGVLNTDSSTNGEMEILLGASSNGRIADVVTPPLKRTRRRDEKTFMLQTVGFSKIASPYSNYAKPSICPLCRALSRSGNRKKGAWRHKDVSFRSAACQCEVASIDASLELSVKVVRLSKEDLSLRPLVLLLS